MREQVQEPVHRRRSGVQASAGSVRKAATTGHSGLAGREAPIPTQASAASSVDFGLRIPATLSHIYPT